MTEPTSHVEMEIQRRIQARRATLPDTFRP